MPHIFSELEKEESIRQLRRNLVSRFYPLSEAEILEHKEKINFSTSGIIKNEKVIWNQILFRKVKDKIDWEDLRHLKSLLIDLSFMIEYEDHIDFSSIGWADNIQWSDGIVDLFGHRIDWKRRACGSGILNSLVKIDRLKNHLDWKVFSGSASTNFSDEVMEHFSDYWDYDALSGNVNLPVSGAFMEKYGSKLNHDILSRNPACFPLFNKYPKSKMWNWKRVIHNPAFEYNDSTFIWAFKHFRQSFSPPSFVQKLKNRDGIELWSFISWVFASGRTDLSYFFQDQFIPFFNWERLSKNCNTPFPAEFLDKHWQNIDFRQRKAIQCAVEWVSPDFLKDNLRLFDKSHYKFYDLPLRIELVENQMKNETNWIWLSSAAKLDWTWDFIQDHWDKFHLNRLSENEGIYEKLIVPEIEKSGLGSLF